MRLATLPILLALCALPIAARADDLTAGSTFTYTLAQYDNTTSTYTTYTSWTLTPGTTAPFVLGAAVGTISEAHTALPGGYDQFTFTFAAAGNTDLFPEYTPGDDYSGFIGIEGLQFDSPYQPTSAILTFASPNGVITFSDGSTANQDFVGSLSNPFDGNFVQNGDLAGYDPIGGQDTTTITLQLTNAPTPPNTNSGSPIAPTPEPSSLALLATGILGAAATARRRLVGTDSHHPSAA